MSGAEATIVRRPLARLIDGLAAAFLLALMTLGAFALWLGVPVACLYVSAKLAHSGGEHFMLDLPMTIAAMIAWGALLSWTNRLYLRVTGVIARYQAEEEEFGPGSAPPFLRGPLEPLLVGSLVIALIALTAWFLFFAHGLDVPSSVAP
jgi:hypothetical protein